MRFYTDLRCRVCVGNVTKVLLSDSVGRQAWSLECLQCGRPVLRGDRTDSLGRRVEAMEQREAVWA